MKKLFFKLATVLCITMISQRAFAEDCAKIANAVNASVGGTLISSCKDLPKKVVLEMNPKIYQLYKKNEKNSGGFNLINKFISRSFYFAGYSIRKMDYSSLDTFVLKYGNTCIQEPGTYVHEQADFIELHPNQQKQVLFTMAIDGRKNKIKCPI